MSRPLELVSLPRFPHNFWKKYFSCYILLIDEMLLSGYLYFMRYWAIYVLQLFINQVVKSWILNLTLNFGFWIYLSNQAFFPTWTKTHDKNLNIFRTKRAFRMKQKAFFIIFNELSIEPANNTNFLGRGESDFNIGS